MSFINAVRRNNSGTTFSAKVRGTGEKVRVKDIASMNGVDLLYAETLGISGNVDTDVSALTDTKDRIKLTGIQMAVNLLCGEHHEGLVAVLMDKNAPFHNALLAGVIGQWEHVLTSVRDVVSNAGFGPEASDPDYVEANRLIGIIDHEIGILGKSKKMQPFIARLNNLKSSMEKYVAERDYKTAIHAAMDTAVIVGEANRVLIPS